MLCLSQTSSHFRADMTVGILRKRLVVKKVSSLRPGGGTSYMKGVGMLVVSLRGVNFGFWSFVEQERVTNP